MTLTIALLYNRKKEIPKNKPEDFYAEFDSEKTIDELKNAIEVNGYNVIPIEADENAYIELKNNKIDFVFNFAEGIRGESRESQIPIFCELLGIPYLGATPSSHAIILNKARTKEVLSFHKIPTANFQVIKNLKEKLREELRFPLIVKPVAEGSSKGLSNENLVKNKEELKRIIKKIIDNYNQNAIIEEYLEGREFTVSIIGNENPLILPILELKFDHLPKNLNKFDHYEAKWIYDDPKLNNNILPIECPAKIPSELEEKIKEISLQTFRVLDCRDWARIDIRLDKNSNPKVMEINCPVGLIKDPRETSSMPLAAYAYGWSYEKLVGEILNVSLLRYGLLKKIKKCKVTQIEH